MFWIEMGNNVIDNWIEVFELMKKKLVFDMLTNNQIDSSLDRPMNGQMDSKQEGGLSSGRELLVKL